MTRLKYLKLQPGKSRRTLVALVAIFLIGLVPCAETLAFAQSSKGIVVGTVTDPSGALVPGATVTIKNKETGVERQTVSTADGAYRLDAVDPGSYVLTVTASGFKSFTVDTVPVSAGQSTTNEIKLELGSTTETVSVTAQSTVELQQQDGTRASTIDQRQITELPNGTLNPAQLVFTLPGVVAPGNLDSGFVQGNEFSINGIRPRGNSQLIDGTENNDVSITGQLYIPTLRDGFKEVSVLGGDNSAEYGRAGGAVVNLITPSGTNRFHGSAYDVINTSALSSLSSGDKVVSGLTSVPVSIENIPGFSIGGPIIKDKLFFFGTMQWDRFRAGGTPVTGVVPTAQGIADLNALFPSGTSANLDRYLNFVGSLRGTTNFVNVPISGGRSIQFGTVTVASPQISNDRQWEARIDWVPTANDNVSFRHFNDQSDFLNATGSIFNGYEIDIPAGNNNFLASYTHTFSPRWVNEFRFSYSRGNFFFNPRDNATLSAGPETFIGGTTITAVGLDPTFPQGRILNNYQYQDTITHVTGNHTIRAGVDLVRQLPFETNLLNSRGTLTFSAGGGASAFQNFIDGFSGTQGQFGSRQIGESALYPKRFQQAYFVNDTWRVKPNLTLNLGLRYENYGTPENVLAFPAFAGFSTAITTPQKQKADNNNFSPRFSFAYTPHASSGILNRLLGDDKTVIRGGYSIVYDVFFDNILINSASSSPNVFSVTTFGINGNTPRGFSNAGVNSLPPSIGTPNPLATIDSIPTNLVNPQTHQWNLGIQRELRGNVLLDVAYVGTRGEKLFINEQFNPGVDGVRINPNFGSILLRTNGGDSNYHSLQVRVERPFKNGLLFRGTYTYSKSIDDVNSEVFTTTGGSSFGSNSFNRRDDRSVSAFDVPHRATISFVYEIPTPRFSFLPLRALLSHYTFSGIYAVQSGAVETPYIGGLDLNGDLNANNDRPAIIHPDAPANSVAILGSLFGVSSPTGYIDANGNPINPANTRYIVDPNIRTNLAGRNTLRAPVFNGLDLSLQKSIPMPWEGHKIDIRVQFFNVLNHPNYTWDLTTSDGNVLNPFFNQPTLNFGSNRTGQIQLRYSF